MAFAGDVVNHNTTQGGKSLNFFYNRADGADYYPDDRQPGLPILLEQYPEDGYCVATPLYNDVLPTAGGFVGVITNIHKNVPPLVGIGADTYYPNNQNVLIFHHGDVVYMPIGTINKDSYSNIYRIAFEFGGSDNPYLRIIVGSGAGLAADCLYYFATIDEFLPIQMYIYNETTQTFTLKTVDGCKLRLC